MATIYNAPEDKDKNQDTSDQSQGVQPGSAGGGSAPAPMGMTQPSKSGRFTNLQTYLNANKPTDQNQGMAAQVAGKVETQGQDVQRLNDKAGAELKGGTDAFKKNIQELGGNFNTQLQQDPTQINAEQFAQARDAQYTGPQQLANQYQLQAGVQGLQTTGGLVGSEAGRKQLLQQTFQGPQYTSGQTALDQALLQSNP